ncbi:hypothetical protein AAHB45_01265 [Pediococcus pentosaceus]|jgi:hypothetical protein|uniref:hypothetical protein n=1 Tax=Pediococcus pentosaceus TaxID=1255 RepID=UPI00235EBAF9|nr:hypothetical protein [Pediococcus pentosaceus]MDD1387781.1 hypothetical protein [Pediococcus pentosaceus]
MKLKINTWSAISDVFNIHFIIIFQTLSLATLMNGDRFLKFGPQNDFLGFLSFIFNIFFLKISIVHLVSFLLILLVIGGLILNIVTLNRNLKSKISIVGPILGIIGNVDCLLGGMFFLTSSVILLIIGAIFSAIQKPVK